MPSDVPQDIPPATTRNTIYRTADEIPTQPLEGRSPNARSSTSYRQNRGSKVLFSLSVRGLSNKPTSPKSFHQEILKFIRCQRIRTFFLLLSPDMHGVFVADAQAKARWMLCQLNRPFSRLEANQQIVPSKYPRIASARL